MNLDFNVLKNDEKCVFEMRELYQRYGYAQYKMSKFEEYDLYVRNKDFLVSDNVITFTDTDGKLMALKPDVTLSIIKNGADKLNSVQKVYYNENVYRVSGTSRSFKEIMQVGLECIGDIDDYCIYEVIMLAAKSLENISKDYVLDISHLGIVSAVIETLGVDGELKSEIIKCIGEKNTYEIEKLCKDAGVNPENAVKLVSTYGSPKKVIAVLKEMNIKNADEQIARLESITSVLEKEGFNVSIDFSVINDMNYYNGFVFKGFIKGISSGVLCGGQYDKLMKKMGRTSGAIGFAVYLDMLERLAVNNKKYDVDTLIVYDDKCTISAINKAIELFSSDTVSVMAQRSVPEKLKYRQLLRLNERGVELADVNA